MLVPELFYLPTYYIYYLHLPYLDLQHWIAWKKGFIGAGVQIETASQRLWEL